MASFLGSTPGCLGAFMDVSLYIHGLISFGAIVGGMIATSGDEAFVMLAQFPGTALFLFGILFIMGIVFAGVSDKIITYFGIPVCEACTAHHCEQCSSAADDGDVGEEILHVSKMLENLRSLSFARFLLLLLIAVVMVSFILGKLGPDSWDWKRITFVGLSLGALYITLIASEHYLHEHIWDHIIKKHLLRVFLWSFGALLLVHVGLAHFSLDAYVREHMIWVLVTAALLGVVPESGPHLVFVMMYAQGLIPFSVLLTSSFVQDGHGILPLLSFSIKDALLLKAFNLIFGLAVGSILFVLGF